MVRALLFPLLLGILVTGGDETRGLSPVSVAGDETPSRTTARSLRFEAGVRDPALALMVALVRDDLRGVFSLGQIEREIRNSGRASRIPPRAFRTLTRVSAPEQAQPVMVIDFPPPGVISVPYDILGYRPGKLRPTPSLRLREWNLGTVQLEAVVEGRRKPIVLEEVRVWGVEQGRLEMDIDGWLDALMGSKLDDTDITGLALFRHRGEWIAMALGYNGKRKGNSGAFSLREDRILFPYPDEYKTCGRYLRAQIERLMRAPRSR